MYETSSKCYINVWWYTCNRSSSLYQYYRFRLDNIPKLDYICCNCYLLCPSVHIQKKNLHNIYFVITIDIYTTILVHMKITIIKRIPPFPPDNKAVVHLNKKCVYIFLSRKIDVPPFILRCHYYHYSFYYKKQWKQDNLK